MDDHKRRRPEHDKFSSPDFESQQRPRTDDPADRLPLRLRARLSLDVPGEHEHERSGDRDRQPPADRPGDAGGSGGNDGGSGGRARIEFNLGKVMPPPAEEAKPRVSRKYSAELAASDAPVLRRLSGGQDSVDRPAAAARGDDRPREQQQQQQQQGEGGSRRLQSPDRGPLGRDRDRPTDRAVDRDRGVERDRERERGDRGLADRDRGPDRPRVLDRDRDRTRDRRDSPADRMRDRGDLPRSSSRPDGPDPRNRTDSAERSRPAAADRGRERSRLGALERSPARSSRERSRERGMQGSRDHARDPPARHPLPREGAARGRDAAGLGSSRDSSRPRGPAGEPGREQRPLARDTKDDGFARPQHRPPPPAQQQQQQQQAPQFARPAPPPRPRLHIQWDEINKADAMLAAVRARHAGLVEQQLKHLILTRALATDNAWDRACQAANLPPEQVDGPLVTAARRADCDRMLSSRVSANMMPPFDPSLPSHLGEAVTEDAYIQQLQAVINRYEQQSAAPYCAEVWALKGAPSARRGAGGVQQEAPEGVSYSLLLPAELRGQLWDV